VELRAGLRVLLVGNSYTRFNVMPRLLERLAQSAHGDRPFHVEVEAKGGCTLRRHWLGGKALTLIRTRHYSHVVLQDHSLRTIDRPAEFDEYVARFDHAIAATSARTVLYGTWARAPSARLYREHPLVRSFQEMADRIDSAYRSAAERLSAQLAPVGPAFERTLAEHPELELYKSDGAHPTMAGSFLAACVIYGTITGEDPLHASYVPYELGPEPAALVKQIASETLSAAPTAPAPTPPAAPAPAPADPSAPALPPSLARELPPAPADTPPAPALATAPSQ
jgi:hypothetical protein